MYKQNTALGCRWDDVDDDDKNKKEKNSHQDNTSKQPAAIAYTMRKSKNSRQQHI